MKNIPLERPISVFWLQTFRFSMNPTRRERWPPIISSRFEYTFEKLWLLVTQKVWKPGSIRSSFWMVFKPWMENEKLGLVSETVYPHENQVTPAQTVALNTNGFCSESVPRRIRNDVPDSGTWCPRMSPIRGHVPESGTSPIRYRLTISCLIRQEKSQP